MKSIALYFEGSEDTIFDPDARDNCTEPFIVLKQSLALLGYTLVVSKEADLSNCTSVLFINSPFNVSGKSDFYDRCVAAGLAEKLFLVLWEGPSVKKENYIKEHHGRFHKILTWNTDLVDNQKFFAFRLPIPTTYTPAPRVPYEQKKFLVNISRNSSSSYPGELYSARKQSITYFTNHFPTNFDLYGFDWETPQTRLGRLFPIFKKHIKSYRGILKNKYDALPWYKYSLCYENLSGTSGYVTEKIFDCLRMNVVPIYWGAPDIAAYVDPACFIDRSVFADDKALATFLLNIDEKRYAAYLTAMNAYLKSDHYRSFLSPAFAETIISVLDLKKVY